MNFLDNLVLPQSNEHIVLLHYMAFIVMLLFIPYLSILTGGMTLSYLYKRKGLKTGNHNYLKFAQEIIQYTTVSKTAGLFLGVVPILALVMIFAQLLHTLKIASVGYLISALVFMVFAVIFIYTYRYSFKFKEVFEGVKNDVKDEEVSTLAENMSALTNKSALWALGFLYIAGYFVIAGITLVMYPQEWQISNSFFHIFISGSIFFKWLFFVALSFALTGSFLMYLYFYWEGGKAGLSDDFKALVREKTLSVTKKGALLLPLTLLLHLVTLPGSAVTGMVFGLSGAALFIIFAVYHLLYDMLKNGNVTSTARVFLLIVVAVIALAVADQIKITQSTSKHSLQLAAAYDAAMKAAEGESAAAEVSGEAIFKAKCSACHKFDQKVVGPPYKETLPKYEGKINELIKFINAPVKVNPDYPPMPAQGLKPKEARAVAEYILSEYKK